MTAPQIDSVLIRAEQQVAEGQGVAGTGFWRAVETVKSDPALVERYASRIATVDQAAFRNWALLVVPITVGTVLAFLATAVGLALLAWAYQLDGLVAVLVFYAGFGIVMVTTHGLAHLFVGRVLGMQFTAWFIGTIRRPQPGVKVDYNTYLRASAQSRAWMHASGAVMSKFIPFAMIGAAVAAGLPWWATWGLAVIGVASIVTDVVWSTKSSDWKKYRREMAHTATS